MSLARKLFADLPISKKLVVLLWLFILLTIGLLGLSYLTIENLSAARAYVGGEGLWSKAQKQAVYDLLQYSVSHSELDYLNYQQSLQVPLGDKQARLELEKNLPDMNVVRQGFIQGRNDPQDVEGMASLFRRFRHSTYMSEAIRIWRQGDQSIDRLQVLGTQLHAEISSPSPDQSKISDISRQVDSIANQLTPLEDRFSYALGEGARQAKKTFLLVTFAAAVFSLAVGFLFTFLMLRHVHQTEERYKHLINTANDSILVMDAEAGIILGANEQTGRLLGRPLGEVVGLRAEDIIEENDRPEYARSLQIASQGVPILAKQFHVYSSAGVSIPVEINATLTEFEGKKIVQGIFRDITERLRLEEQIRQAQKLEVVGKLAGGIAHDFNNLLMVILTQLSKLRTFSSRTQFIDRIETIRSAAERASALTKQLLAFGRKQVLDLEVVDLNELLGEVKGIIATLPSSHVVVKLSPSAQSLPVEVDPSKIEQVIMNLALNAFDAMPSGGVLTIHTSQVFRNEREERNKEITGPTRLYALLEIKDTGSGMDTEVKAHIFEPFFTTKPSGKGTGLGLSTVYGIVNQSGGIIEVESSVGEGTTFKVYFPIATTPIVPRTSAKIAASAMIGSETVLLVEDQPSIREALHDFLSSQGYKVLDAQNGRDALELAESYPDIIDVLVTDIVIPQVRGLELAERVTELHPAICVIFMSGYSEEALREKRLLSQANAVLIQKPFEPEELARKIRDSYAQRSKSSNKTAYRH